MVLSPHTSLMWRSCSYFGNCSESERVEQPGSTSLSKVGVVVVGSSLALLLLSDEASSGYLAAKVWSLLTEIGLVIIFGGFLAVCGGKAAPLDQGKANEADAAEAVSISPRSQFIKRLEKAVQEQDVHRAYGILKAFEEAGHETTSHYYNIVLRSFAKEGCLEEAVDVFDRMHNRNVAPGPAIYNSLIDAFAKANCPERAEALLQDMQDWEVKPCLITYSSLIYGRAKRGEYAAAEAWFDEMVANGISPDGVTCNMFIHAHTVKGDVCGAEKWLCRAMKWGFNVGVPTFSAVIDACAKNADWRRAEKWLDVMCKNQLEPNVVTYSSVIDACAKAGEAEKAEAWFNRMISNGISPNLHSFGSMVNACAKASLSTAGIDAERWIDQAEACGVIKDGVIYSTGVDAAGKAGDVERAERLFNRLLERGFEPHTKCFCALARAYAHKGMWQKVEDVEKKMVALNFDRNEFFVYAQLISYALAKPRRSDRAERCFISAVKRGVEANEHLASALQRSVGRTRAEQLLGEHCPGRKFAPSSKMVKRKS